MKPRFAAIAFAVIMLAGVSRADSIYDVSGQIVFSGNDACGGVCTETLNFSFQLGYALGSAAGYEAYVPYIVPNSSTVVSIGPLDPFFGGTGVGFDGRNYIPYVDNLSTTTPRDEIDLIESGGGYYYQNPSLPPAFPGPPAFLSAYFYHCYTVTCAQDFPTMQGLLFGTVEAEVVPASLPVPEGSAFPMGGIALLLVFGAMARHRFHKDQWRPRRADAMYD